MNSSGLFRYYGGFAVSTRRFVSEFPVPSMRRRWTAGSIACREVATTAAMSTTSWSISSNIRWSYASSTSSSSFRSFTSSSTSTKSSKERLRVAIVGGSVAALSTALQLVPLIKEGLIAYPIDIYDSDERISNRDIGVGIWSTAINCFKQQNSKEQSTDSLQIVYQDMIRHGTYINKVGYRTPHGAWLAESNLHGDNLPDLLFLRECDMLAALRKAIHLEVTRGNIILHSGIHYKVHSIVEDSTTEAWSAPLLLETDGPDKPLQSTGRDYHLVVAADGMNSVLRKNYGGHLVQSRILTGTYVIGDSSDVLDQLRHGGGGGTDSTGHSGSITRTDWEKTIQNEAIQLQDRHYYVFRGNAPITRQDIPGLDKSFQTWGEGQNMRFATVPMAYPGSDGQKEERQVWFITIDDKSITSEKDPVKRRDMLLDAFRHWHDPICQLVMATPPHEILMERALAHRHSQEPVIDFYGLVNKIHKKPVPAIGNGPVIQFVGDSMMTVDPILAQGFTVAMEASASLAQSLSSCLAVDTNDPSSKLAFDPYLLRKELIQRHDVRLSRLICLLRITELVQSLGQPTTGTVAGMISRDIIRPMMRITPSFVKTPIFNAVLKYSLGLPNNGLPR